MRNPGGYGPVGGTQPNADLFMFSQSEMLKMKIDPAMRVKTKAKRQNIMVKTSLFADQYTSRAVIDKNRAYSTAENAEIAR